MFFCFFIFFRKTNRLYTIAICLPNCSLPSTTPRLTYNNITTNMRGKKEKKSSAIYDCSTRVTERTWVYKNIKLVQNVCTTCVYILSIHFNKTT